MTSRLVYHKANGGVSLQKLSENGKDVIHSELVVRFVYADEKLVERLLAAVREEYESRGELGSQKNP